MANSDPTNNSAAQSTGGLFYGWRVVGAASVGMALSFAAFGIFGFSTFIIPLQEEFGWTRGEISVAASIAIAVSSVLAPFVGALMDKVGVRRVLIVSITLFGLAVASLNWLTASLTHYYAIYFLLAFVGAGTLPLAYSHVIVAWFDRKRGMALGLGLAGLGVGASLLPLILNFAIEARGVRFGYLTMAAMTLFIALPIIASVLRNKPADLGLAPDGDPPTSKTNANLLAQGFTLQESLRQPVFWLMVPSFLMVGVVVVGIVSQLRPLLIDTGFDAGSAGSVLFFMGLLIIVGRIVAGYFMDRFFAPFVAVAFLIGPMLGIASFALGLGGAPAVIAALLLGLAVGAEFDVMAYFISRYFGQRSFGLLYGLMFAAFQAGATIGPAAMGWNFDRNGDYVNMLWVLVALLATACIMLSRFPRFPTLPEREI